MAAAAAPAAAILAMLTRDGAHSAASRIAADACRANPSFVRAGGRDDWARP